ncbi:carbohydrate-selective porin OprB [Bradyrhizobium sp. i1.7.7]
MSRTKRRFGQLLLAATLFAAGTAAAQEDKKTDDDKPADPDTGESTVEEKTLGLLPNPYQKYGVKFAATYIGEVLGNPSGGLKQGSVYEGRLNLAVDLDLQKLAGLDQRDIPCQHVPDPWRRVVARQSTELLCGQRDRGVAVHASLRGVL